MTKAESFVALKAFRFGTTTLQPGDVVPVEAGRDYRLMLRLGQIAPAGSATLTAGAQQEPQTDLLSPYEEGSTVVFVGEDDAFHFVTFREAMEVPDEAREGLGLNEGDPVALVEFPDDPDHSTFVPLASLLPEQPTRRLIEDLQVEVDARQGDVDTLTRERDEAGQETERLRAALQKAEEEGGAAQAQVATLTAQLAEAQAAPIIPADALKRIEGVKGVGEKLAPVILAALMPAPEDAPTPDTGPVA